MLKQNMTLQEMLSSKITQQDFDSANEDTHGIIKIIVAATLKERAYDFLNILTQEDRRKYTLDLFESIETTPWFDFVQPNGGKFVLIWQLETVADEEEIIEYFSECLQEFNQAFGDVIIEYVAKDTVQEVTRIFTHEDSIHTTKSENKNEDSTQ